MLSVIICTYMRDALALKAAASAHAQLPPGGEIVVVDQSPAASAGFEAWAARDPSVRYFRLRKPGLTNARNFGAQEARGDALFYLDDDAVVRPGALQSHLDELAKEGVAGTSGPVYDFAVVPPKRTGVPIGKISVTGKHIQNRDASEYRLVDTLFGGNMALRRAQLLEAGGFETAYTGLATWEETCLSFRLSRMGWRLSFNPGAAIDHYPQATGNQASSRASRGLEYYASYVRNGTCAFLRGRPRWQLLPFALRHAALCESKALLGLRRPGLGLLAFSRGFREGFRIFRDRGQYPRFDYDGTPP